jgi:hypothetical protein
MRSLRLMALSALPLALTLAVATPARPTTVVAQATATASPQMEAAVKKALQSANLTLHQKMQIKPMLQQYESSVKNADPAAKQAAQKKLMQGIYGVLTPAQQSQVKASMKSSMGT